MAFIICKSNINASVDMGKGFSEDKGEIKSTMSVPTVKDRFSKHFNHFCGNLFAVLGFHHLHNNSDLSS